MSWSLKFDEPVELAKGKPLRTPRDAGDGASLFGTRFVLLCSTLELAGAAKQRFV
jgi:hypothetical protein